MRDPTLHTHSSLPSDLLASDPFASDLIASDDPGGESHDGDNRPVGVPPTTVPIGLQSHHDDGRGVGTIADPGDNRPVADRAEAVVRDVSRRARGRRAAVLGGIQATPHEARRVGA